MKSAPAIGFEYRPSRFVTSAVIVIIALAILSIAFSGLALETRIGLGAAMLTYGSAVPWRFLKSPACRCLWHDAGHWRIADANGAEHVAELLRNVVRGDFIVLTLSGRKRKTMLILAPDNSDADLRRSLRVRLARSSALPSGN